MKRFNCSTVKPSSHLTPTCEKQKAALRRENGVKQRHAVDREVKPFDGEARVKNAMARKPAPLRADFVPRKPRGQSHCRLSHELRLLVLQKAEKRHAFFAGLSPA